MLTHISRRLSLAVAATLCAWGSLARADEAIDPLDLRCLVVSMQMQSSGNAELKAAAPPIMMYYLGRLQRRDSTVDLFEPIVKVLSSWTAADSSSEAVRCGREIQQAGLNLKSVGLRLIQRGQQMNDEAAADSAAQSPTPEPGKAPR